MAETAYNPSVEVESFLDLLFEGQEGFVYCPTKNPKTGYWQPYFFSWPQHRADIVSHMMDASRSKEAYLSPSLFKEMEAKKDAWSGTNYVWVEFDGNAPIHLPEGIPSPSIRIQSSTKGHEHWYWKLNNFETEMAVVEGLSKQLAYTLESDKSGWDANQVLRAPGTMHHDTKRRVRLLKSNGRKYGISEFIGLVEPPPAVVVNTNIKDLPDVADVVAKYKFSTDARDLFRKATQPHGSRSHAMMRMAYHCIEMGMSDEEAYVILMNCDDRWGKYKNRDNRSEVFLDQIAKARQKKGMQAEKRLDDVRRMVSLRELLALDFSDVGWWFDDLFAETTLGFIAGDPGVGKSTFMMQMSMDVSIGKDFLEFQNNKTDITKVGFFSFEMDAFQLQHFFVNMLKAYDEPQRNIILDNLYLDTFGSNHYLTSKKPQQEILDFVDHHELKYLTFDSLRAVTGLKDDNIEDFIDFVDKDLRRDRGCSVWIIHHNRKPGKGEQREEQTLADLYGSTSIGASAATVMGLEAVGAKKEKARLNSLKLRLAPGFDSFKIRRYADLPIWIPDDGKKEPVAEKKTDGKGGMFGGADPAGIDI